MDNTPKCKAYTNKDKWIVACISGLLFLLLSSPYLYMFTGSLLKGLASHNGTPTIYGLILHAIIFILAARLLMR